MKLITELFNHQLLDQHRLGVEQNSNELDPWKILGCDKDSTLADIKAAFHRAMRLTHPDKAATKNISESRMSQG